VQKARPEEDEELLEEKEFVSEKTKRIRAVRASEGKAKVMITQRQRVKEEAKRWKRQKTEANRIRR
jgi:hypothetical protein